MSSLPNKLDKLTALTQHQRDYRECSIMVLTETWLNALTLDTDANLDGFQMWWVDWRQRAVRGREEGWLCLFMTDGVSLGTSLLKSGSAVRASNF